MTSSLVGSEMCIRDRQGGVAGPVFPPHHLLLWLWAGGHLPATQGQAGPVSYTHLTLPTICSV
eukprot:4810430-Prorocentrum_lima.AAC.1